MDNPNGKQVGGNHYQSQYQCWDFIHDLRLSFLEGSVAKYISRHRRKDGIKDLQKAQHFIEKLLSIHKEQLLSFSTRICCEKTMSVIDTYLSENSPGPTEDAIIVRLCFWQTEQDLRLILKMIKSLETDYLR